METERKVYLNAADVPAGTKVLGIKVKNPMMLLLSGEGPGEETIIYAHRTVCVELTVEEFLAARGDQQKIDALGRELGPLVQRRLGASWHRWIEEEKHG